MPITFHASQVITSEEDGLAITILSVDENLAAQRYLMFQRSLTPSQQDLRLGMTDVYIETCGQGWSWYGHIQSVQLSRSMVLVQLDREAAQQIGDTGRIEVTFDLSYERFAVLREALRRVLNDRDYYTEVAA